MGKDSKGFFSIYRSGLFIGLVTILICTAVFMDSIMAAMCDKPAVKGPAAINADIGELEKLRQETSTLNTDESRSLAATLAESINISKEVLEYETVSTSGNCVARFDKDGVFAGYLVLYQAKEPILHKRLGNLVHELTHCYVNKKYDRYFYNFSNVQKPEIKPVFNNGCIRNEEKLQLAMNKNPGWSSGTKILGGNLVTLKGLIPAKWEHKALFTERCDYGARQPDKEYDTVVNHMMVYCHFLDCKKQPKFYSYLRAIADDARERRMTGKQVTAKVNIPK
jgi:hypothetical protein